MMKTDINKLCMIDIRKLYMIPKAKIASFLFYSAILLAFFGSMRVWFLVPVTSYYPIFAFFLAAGAMVISRPLKQPLFTAGGNVLIPVICYVILALYQAIVNGSNINAYITALFNAAIFYTLFIYDKERLAQLSTVLAKTMGCILLVSIPTFFMYIVGISLPNSDLTYNDGFYYFSNYYFFLIDERSLFSIIPRFQSIFLEPTYMGSTAALILQTQRGRWKKWYNILLLTALFLSFSLAGYAYLTAIIFLNLWVEGKKIMKKALTCIAIIACVVGGSFVYNGGDNLLHDLIILRLEIDDGELAGNNRVTADFDAEYESYLESSDIIFGRDYDTRFFGDSGYKVYIFDYGLIGVLLLFLFYGSSFITSKNRRSMIAAWVVFLLIWGVDAFVLWFGRFIPLFITAYSPVGGKEDNANAEKATKQ